MTANNIIKAAASKLVELYPERHVFTGEIGSGSDGNHYIRCINQSHEKRLDRRRARSYSFEILYFQRQNDALTFNEWAEAMYMEFEELYVNGQVLHVTNAHAEPGDDMVFHFVFDVSFTALVAPVVGDPMEILTNTEGLKV